MGMSVLRAYLREDERGFFWRWFSTTQDCFEGLAAARNCNARSILTLHMIVPYVYHVTLFSNCIRFLLINKGEVAGTVLINPENLPLEPSFLSLHNKPGFSLPSLTASCRI